MALTYDFRVRVDILNSLKMKDPYIAVGSFDRKNLFYGVKSFNRGHAFVDELVREVSKCVAAGSTIIYCTTVRDVNQVHHLQSYKIQKLDPPLKYPANSATHWYKLSLWFG